MPDGTADGLCGHFFLSAAGGYFACNSAVSRNLAVGDFTQKFPHLPAKYTSVRAQGQFTDRGLSAGKVAIQPVPGLCKNEKAGVFFCFFLYRVGKVLLSVKPKTN